MPGRQSLQSVAAETQGQEHLVHGLHPHLITARRGGPFPGRTEVRVTASPASAPSSSLVMRSRRAACSRSGRSCRPLSTQTKGGPILRGQRLQRQPHLVLDHLAGQDHRVRQQTPSCYRTALIIAATFSGLAVIGTSQPEPRMKPPSCPMNSMSSRQYRSTSVLSAMEKRGAFTSPLIHR